MPELSFPLGWGCRREHEGLPRTHWEKPTAWARGAGDEGFDKRGVEKKRGGKRRRGGRAVGSTYDIDEDHSGDDTSFDP